MDFPETQPDRPELLPPRLMASEPPVILELQQQCQDLKRLFNATFVALIALALGVNLFMAKETRIVRRDLDLKRPVWLRECDNFRKLDEPEIRKFMAELHRYAASPCRSTSACPRWCHPAPTISPRPGRPGSRPDSATRRRGRQL